MRASSAPQEGYYFFFAEEAFAGVNLIYGVVVIFMLFFFRYK